MATITGTQNADTLEGTTGDDTIDGRRAADTLIGMEGNDLYIFDRLEDSAVETEWGGNDTVRISFTNDGAAIGVDMRAVNFANVENLEFARAGLFNAIGNDLDNAMTGNASINHLSGGAGNDTLDGKAGSDTLDGGEGDDTFYVENSGDVVVDSGGSWDSVYAKLSWVMGEGIENLLLTGTGNYSGTGNASDNYIAGNSGANTLSGGGGYDQLAGGAGNDTYIITSNEGSNYTAIFEDFNGGIDTVRASTAYYTLDANVEKLVLTEAAGDASGYGNDLANVLTGNSHTNTLSGGAGVDTLEGGTGDDTYHSDILFNGTQVVIEDKVKEQIGEGNDTLVLYGYVDAASATTLTLANNLENIDASNTGSTLLDLTGNNVANILTGNDADNIITGKKGDDLLMGWQGNDTYRFAHGDGHDTIQELSGADRIVFTSSAIKPVNTSYSQITDDLVIRYGTQGDTIHITNFFSGADGVEEIVFANGTVHDLSYILAHLVPYATAADDVVIGAATYDTLDGLAGNDTLLGRGANDTLLGGDGNDTLDGGADDDLLMGGTGDDTYIFSFGSGREDVVTEEGGTNTISFAASITAGSVSYHDDGMGNLTINYGGSTDHLTVTGFIADSSLLAQVTFGDGTFHDASYILSHLTPAFVTLTEENDDYYAGFGEVYIRALGGNDMIYGSEGASTFEGGSGNDTLYGGSNNDTLIGGTGEDLLQGGEGNNVYVFNTGDGHDVINAYGNDDDSIYFGPGIDPATVTYTRYGDSLTVAYGGAGDTVTISNYFEAHMFKVSSIRFDDGTVHDVDYVLSHMILGVLELTEGDDYYSTDSLYPEAVDGRGGDDKIGGGNGNDTLYGGSGNDRLDGDSFFQNGNDILVGGKGDDTLRGGGADDTYIFSSGDGVDRIWDQEGVDTISFDATVAVSDVVYIRDGVDLVISYGEGNSITSEYYFIEPVLLIESISFAEGTTHNAEYIVSHLFAGGVVDLSEGNDNFRGSIYSDVINGLGGDDSLYGGSGDDMLTGGDGNDSLIGGEGDNELDGGAGNDLLSTDEGNDTLDGGSGNDELYGGVGDDLYLLEEGDGVDRIGDGGGANVIRFASGVYATDSMYFHINDDLIVSYGGTGDWLTFSNFFSEPFSQTLSIVYGDGIEHDSVYIQSHIFTPLLPTESDDILFGSPVQDYIDGLDGNDTIYGRGGSDFINGGDGDDVFHVNSLGDSIDGGAGIDTIIAGNMTQGISLGSYASVENIILTGTLAGSAFGSNDVDNYMRGSDGDGNWLYAGSGNDMLESGGGTADLMGGSGDDIYYVHHFGDWALEQADSGYDVLYADVSYTIFGSSIEEFILLGTGDLNAIVEACGNAVTVSGTLGNNTLIGSYGSDIISGYDGNDVLGGHFAMDTLTGGAGDDSFMFDQNAYYGIDTITDFSGNDDRVDISQLLTEYDPLTMAFADFVLVEESGGDTILSVDTDGTGGGHAMVQIATLSGVTGLGTADDMLAAGQLVVGV